MDSNTPKENTTIVTLSLFPLTEKKMQIKQRPEVHDPHEI
jgi:hypothetical protein